ncbi:unnamed protein product [Prunus brigantina]
MNFSVDEKKEIPSVVYQFNSSINFFCKAKMMDDALKTYGRMQEMKIQPTEQTFTYLLYAILWGNIKRNMESGNLVVSRDLHESEFVKLHKNLYRNLKPLEARTEVQLIEEKFNMNWDDLLQEKPFMLKVLQQQIWKMHYGSQVKPNSYSICNNTMITGFIQNGDLKQAKELFIQMPQKNVISWTTMITGYVQDGQNENALMIFSKMLVDNGVKPNQGTL